MNNLRKLLHHDKVEVRQLEEGLRGSWHSGVVVGVSDSCRNVRYDELLSESGRSKLVESIPVSGAIEGLHQRPCVKYSYRGRIRPIPPRTEPCSLNSGLKFGVCVDVLYKEGWWEGVIFDCYEAAKERLVYFPDEGDVRVYKLSDIRVTFEWDEFSGNWRERGIWLLVNLAREYKKDGNLFQLIRRVWSHLKVHYGFQKMISEWTCGSYCVWKEYFREVISEISSKPRTEAFVLLGTSHRHVVKKRSRRSKRGSYLNGPVLTRSMQRRKDKEVNLAVRTRSMCMSEPETSPISAATKGMHLADFECRQNHSTAADSCIITESPIVDARGEYDLVASVCCVHLSDRVKEKGKFRYGRTAQNPNLHTRTPCCFGNHSKMPVKNHFRRKWHFVENSLIPRKPGFTVRYSALREGGRRRISRPIIRKKKSSLRIQKTSSRKRVDNVKFKSTLPKEFEASKSSRKEGDVLGSHCEITLPVADSCQELGSEDALNNPDKHRARKNRYCDSVCFICQYGDELLHCDNCLSSYHLPCVDLEKATIGGLFCPSCRCGLSGLKDCSSDEKLFSDVCYQCSRRYHLACLRRAGISISEDNRFCSKSCFEICARLHQLLRISNPTSVEGLTWTITRSRRNDCNVYNERVHPLIQVSQVLNVFHECFQPIAEPHTGRDLVADIVYNSGSKLRRLDFHGFYVMALVDGDNLVCAATIRIHGQKVAEMPLIATPFKYRHQGMCRLLLHELEKMLVELGVERLVLPGIATLSDTWVSSFGFTEMPASVRRELLGYPFVIFQGTTMFEKILSRSSDEANEHETSSSNECGMQRSDTSHTTRRVLRPITRTYSRMNNWNMDFSNSKLGINYEGSLQESVKPNSAQLKRSQKICSKNERTRISLCHKRRKLESCNEEKAATDGSDKDQPPFKCVYKRRRIQASRDSSDSL